MKALISSTTFHTHSILPHFSADSLTAHPKLQRQDLVTCPSPHSPVYGNYRLSSYLLMGLRTWHTSMRSGVQIPRTHANARCASSVRRRDPALVNNTEERCTMASTSGLPCVRTTCRGDMGGQWKSTFATQLTFRRIWIWTL